MACDIYFIWLQGCTSEGYYSSEENNSWYINKDVQQAKRFPTESSAKYRAEMIKQSCSDLVYYEIIKY